jgi:ribosomal protein S18 acetylase RimI-like enzyme
MLVRELIARFEERTVKKSNAVVKFVVVLPAVVKDDFADEVEGKSEDEKQAIERNAYDSAVGFYRAQGFRRMGLSKWFGLALDPGHRSRHIALENDLDSPALV